MSVQKLRGKVFVGILAGALVVSMAGCGNSGAGGGNTGGGSMSTSVESTAGASGTSSEGSAGGSSSGETARQGGESASQEDDGPALPVMETTFDSMIWGEYTYDEWITEDKVDTSGKAYTQYDMDADKFMDGMKYENYKFTLYDGTVIDSYQWAVLPYEIISAGPISASRVLEQYLKKPEIFVNVYPLQTVWGIEYYWNFMGWDGDWESKKQENRVHDAFVEHFGNETYWENYKNLLRENIILMSFAEKGLNTVAVDFLYEIEGNKIILYQWKADEMTFELTKEKWGEFEFAFEGKNLLLKKGCVREMTPHQFSQEKLYGYAKQTPSIYSYSDSYKKRYQNITAIAISTDGYCSIDLAEGYIASNTSVSFSENNEVTLTWDGVFENAGTHTETFQYIDCDPLGLILIKDGVYYPYLASPERSWESRVEDVVDQETLNMGLSQSQVDDLVKKQSDILRELQEAFRQAGINVEIDPDSGKVTLDSSILFAVNDASLSAAGKDYLDRFFGVYNSVVMSDKYKGIITSILVEGHTDTDGTYDYNMDLSERRAGTVVDYCLTLNPEMKDHLSAKGCSYDEPVYDRYGKVDKAASRRVVFKFRLKVE